ncbi:MAG: general secretion pathway protein GspB [Gammaproteobacteria bacterium]
MSERSRVLAAGAVALAGLLAAGESPAQLRDPTQPTPLEETAPARPVQSGPRWRLQSTLVADDRRLAVINGRTVAQGERIDGATVQEVRQGGVTLEIEGRRIELRLLRDSADVKGSAGSGEESHE